MDATFMTALQIDHVRHLHNIHINLSTSERKSLILTGKNGSGKTSVLEALVKFLNYAISGDFNDRETILSTVQKEKSSIISNPQTEREKQAVELHNNMISYYENSYDIWTNNAVAEYTSYTDLRKKYQSGQYILAYYGDSREIKVLTSRNIEKVDLQPYYSLNDHPSHQLVKYLVNLKTTAAFALAKSDLDKAKEIDQWFCRFEHVLQSVYDDPCLKLDFNIDTFQFTILQKGREPFDFNAMSMGYAAVFDIISDLMMRMESHHRYDLEGLVLIDEIETHLHVDLQKKIVPILMDLFPNIQFLLTTHSPFILNSTPNATVYDLESHKCVTNGLTDLPYEGIVEGYFGADTLSQILRTKFSRYQEIVRKPDLTDQDYAEAAELELYLDEIPDYLALDFATEYSRLKLEFSQRE